MYGALEVKHLFHGILHLLLSSFFVRLGSPFLRPDPHVGRRRAQGLSRPAVAPPVPHARSFPGRALTAPSTAAPWQVGMTCPRGARCRARSSIAPQPCIRSIREDRTMMQSSASVAKLRGGGSNLHSGLEAMVFTSDHRHLGWSSADPGTGRQAVVLLSFPFHIVAYDAGRKTMPSDTSPVVTRRQRAMSSFRANATIIVLRVLPRPSAVRA